MIPHNYGSGSSIYSDATLTGYGLISVYQWLAGYFKSDQQPQAVSAMAPDHHHWINLSVRRGKSINFLELIPVWLACVMWGVQWKNQEVVCWSDNTQVVSAINRGTSCSPLAMALLRQVFWYSVRSNFHLVSRHIPGVLNKAPDFLSRVDLHSPMSDFNKHVSCCCRKFRVPG